MIAHLPLSAAYFWIKGKESLCKPCSAATNLHLDVCYVCASQVLELLLAMCSVSGLRSLLCEVVFKPAGPKLRAAGRDGGRKAQCGLALVQWLSSPVEGGESCSLQVLQLLSELLEVR